MSNAQLIVVLFRVPLESVSIICTRFFGFSLKSSFGLNRLGSKLAGMFFKIVPMFVPKDFGRHRARTCLPTNFEPKRLKPKLDIVENSENRMHILYTDTDRF